MEEIEAQAVRSLKSRAEVSAYLAEHAWAVTQRYELEKKLRSVVRSSLPS